MKDILERLAALKELDIEGADALSEDIKAAYKQMRESGEIDLDLGKQYVEALSTIAGYREELIKEAQEAQKEIEALDAAVFGAPEAEGEAKAEDEAEEVKAEDEEPKADDEAADQEPVAENQDVDQEKELVSTQASRRIIKLAPLDAGRQASVPEAKVEDTIDESAKIFDANDNVVDMDKLSSVLTRAAKSARIMTEEQLENTLQTEGSTPKTTVLKFSLSDAIPKVGRFADFETSEEAFQAALSEKRQQRAEDARAVASGGPCAPRRQEYAIDIIGGDAEPVGDSLVSVSSDGKGVSFFRDLEFSDLTTNWTGGINTYTQAQDTSGSAYPKGLASVTCPSPATCDKEIREKGIKFGNWMTWAFPELVSAIQNGGKSVFARHLEEARLNAIYDYANSIGNVLVDTSQNLDANVNLIDKILRIVVADRRDNRLGGTQQRYIAYLPEWSKAQLTLGLAARLDGLGSERLTVEQATFEILSRWNIDVVFYQDRFKSATGTAGQLPSAIQNAVGTTFPLWQTTVRIGLVRDNAAYIDRGPTLDLGMVRTQSYIEQNNYTLFYETLEGICFKNKGVFVLDTLLCPNGAQAGTVTPTCAGVTSILAS